MTDVREELALELFEKASMLHKQGDFALAVDLYRRSIELHPTAEAHTWLGWSYRRQGRFEDAIRECKKAISLDPDFGNPYNDIGAYLIELGREVEAVAWLEKAVVSKRYNSYHFPWYNLGRVWAARELFNRARECFEMALEIEPEYAPAAEALERIRRLVQ